MAIGFAHPRLGQNLASDAAWRDPFAGPDAPTRRQSDSTRRRLVPESEKRDLVNGLRETFGSSACRAALSTRSGSKNLQRAKKSGGTSNIDRSERKAAVSAYKERKSVASFYAVRCAATDEQGSDGARSFHDLDPPHVRAARASK